MDHFLDIELQQDPEFPPDMLRSALVMKLHRALFDAARTDVGISFPDYDLSRQNLGSRLRIHSGLAMLDALQGTTWLKGMLDHVRCGEPKPVPLSHGHRHWRRIRPLSNMERIKRRQLKRHPDQQAAIEARFLGARNERTRACFVLLRSKSTGENYPLFIEPGPIQPNAQPGVFNFFGLSSNATLPWF